MKLFLCIGYFDPARMAALPRERVDAVMAECRALLDTLYATDRVLFDVGVDEHGAMLGATAAELADFAPAQRVGGTFLIEAKDLDDARRLAALHPSVSLPAARALGWRLEVRPVHYFRLLREELA